MSNYIKDKPNNNAPRLPNLTKNVFGNIITKIKKTLHEIIENCIINKNIDYCLNHSIRLIIINNKNHVGKIIYDSLTDSKYKLDETLKNILEIMNLNNLYTMT